MPVKGKPVKPISRSVPFCAVSYKGEQFVFVAHDDTYCVSPLTGELLLRHQPGKYYLDHLKQTLKEYPDLRPVY